MAINIDDLDDNLQPVGASLLSGNDSIMDNLRELSDEELKTSGGGKKGGGSFFFSQPAPVAQQPVFAQPVAQPVFAQPTFAQPVATGFPVGGGFPVGVGGGFGGFRNFNLEFNVSPIAGSNSRANALNLL